MIDSDRTIVSNVLPGNVPVTFPHPVRAAKEIVRSFPNAVRGKMQTAKGEFGLPGDTVAFSFRHTPALSRIRIEVFHPQEVDVFGNGQVIPVSQNEDALFSGRWNTPSELVQAKGVETFRGIFTRDGNLLGTPSFKHHVQSTAFVGKSTQDHQRGTQAGKFHGADILEGLERFGIEFLESITDPDLRAKAAKTLLEVRDLLVNPNKLLGPGFPNPRLTPDAMYNSEAFNDFATAVVKGSQALCSQKGLV